jgi:hypothetical protein
MTPGFRPGDRITPFSARGSVLSSSFFLVECSTIAISYDDSQLAPVALPIRP